MSATAAEKYRHLFNYTKMLLSANMHLLITLYKIWKCVFEYGYYIIIIMICFVIFCYQYSPVDYNPYEGRDYVYLIYPCGKAISKVGCVKRCGA